MKFKITKSIAYAIRSQNPPGRFLERNSSLDAWKEVEDKKALQKIRQSLRDSKKYYPEDDGILPEACLSAPAIINSTNDSTQIDDSNKENLRHECTNVFEGFDYKKLNSCAQSVPKCYHFESTHYVQRTDEQNPPILEKKDEKYIDNALYAECYKHLNIHNHEHLTKGKERVNQDEVDDLIHQTFFGIAE